MFQFHLDVHDKHNLEKCIQEPLTNAGTPILKITVMYIALFAASCHLLAKKLALYLDLGILSQSFVCLQLHLYHSGKIVNKQRIISDTLPAARYKYW